MASDISGMKDDFVEPDQDKDLRLIKRGFYFFGAVAIAGLLIYATHVPSWVQLAEVVGSGLLIASASFLLGALLGFIFAIPRALQGQRLLDHGEPEADSSMASGPSPAYQVNTNLEQISDWLTKIIVGVGLVQLGRVPEYARRLGDYFSSCLGNAAFSPAVAVTLIVAFLVFGFLTGYLITRLYVTGALKRAEGDVKPVEPTSGIRIGVGPEQIDVVTKPSDLPVDN